MLRGPGPSGDGINAIAMSAASEFPMRFERPDAPLTSNDAPIESNAFEEE